MAIRVLPLPYTLSGITPDWVLLVILSWLFVRVESVSVITACFVGLLVDVLTGHILGQHAFIYALVCFICIRMHKRLKNYSLRNQQFIIFLLLTMERFLLFFLESMQNITPLQITFWLPVFAGTLCWHLVHVLLKKFIAR